MNACNFTGCLMYKPETRLTGGTVRAWVYGLYIKTDLEFYWLRTGFVKVFMQKVDMQ